MGLRQTRSQLHRPFGTGFRPVQSPKAHPHNRKARQDFRISGQSLGEARQKPFVLHIHARHATHPKSPC